MNRRSHSWTAVFTFILITFTFTFPTTAQKTVRQRPIPIVDTAINPHDFTNDYYFNNGINPKEIIGRRTGTDGLSVFGISSDPTHSSVRVIATLPGYDQDGNIVFWYPLGDLTAYGFTDDKIGVLARETAKLYPIYIFPDLNNKGSHNFEANRQAPLVDDSWSMYMGKALNPVGVREVFFVNYTEKAFGKENAEIMAYFAKKNGLATDDTPIIKTVDDIKVLRAYDLISFGSMTLDPDRPIMDMFIMSPIIRDPLKGVIAKDAFILMAEKDGDCLPTEEIFEWHFNCLQTTGSWCQ